LKLQIVPVAPGDRRSFLPFGDVLLRNRQEALPMAKLNFSLYLSHSWRPSDVDLNQFVWDRVCNLCTLLVEENEGAEPAYYINRIEEYIRRSDLFFAILTYRSDEQDYPKCSKASLFEVRLAERARKPRFVLYEGGSGFEPPADRSDYVRYEVFDRGDLLNRNSSSAVRAIDEWLNAIKDALKPRKFMFHEASLILLPETPRDVLAVVERALREGHYTRMCRVNSVMTDFQVINQLECTGLLVADLSATAMADLHAMAHALFLPTIRIARQGPNGSKPPLPWYLKGHPTKGYDTDVVYYSKAKELEGPIQKRAAAMRDTRKPISSREEGRLFFEKRRQRPHMVFISHCLKGKYRVVIDRTMALLKSKGIECWEYEERGQSGADWERQLNDQLNKSTHAVIVISEDFNNSPWCFKEVERLYMRRQKVDLLPFLYGRDARPAPRLEKLQHENLPDNANEAARQIVGAVQQHIGA
jgi:TIR domain